jgi:hypothetical protein
MTPSTATLAAPISAAGNKSNDNNFRDLQVESLRKTLSIDLPLAFCLATLVYGSGR